MKKNSGFLLNIFYILNCIFLKYKMSFPILIPRVLYGQRLDVKKNAHYITDSDIVYASGAVVVFQNILSNSQKYLILPEKTSGMELLLVSPLRNLMAVLVKGEEKSEIHIYDLKTYKKMRTLSLPPEATTKKIVSVDFSYDEKFIMVITGDPDWMMLAYNWERGKVETSTKANLLTNPLAPVSEVVCSPVDSSILVIYGPGLFRLMNMQETVWRQYGFQKAENFDISSCCFLTGDRVLCGTKDGLLLLIDLGELKFIFEAEVVNYINARPDKEEEFLGVVPSSTVLDRAKAFEDENMKDTKAVRALTTLSNGFAFSCGPVVHFFEKISLHKYRKRNLYEITDKDFRENQTMSIATVTHLALNRSETRMMATTRRSQLYEVKLWGPEMDIAGKVPFKHLWFSLHTGKIQDLALCYWKPIFMTCGAVDRTVRVWNYVTNSLEMVKQYQEDIHSVSLHPTGLYAAIGFSDKLRFIVVMIDDLQVSREFPIRECPKSAFNISGNLLAAVNRNVIQIYNIITFQNIAVLKGHNGTIKSLQWTQDDKKLISCGTDGAIYEWDMNTFKRIGEVVHKGVTYWECDVLSNGKNIYAVGSDNYLKEIRSSNVLRSINLHIKNINHVTISRSDLMMFVSSAQGSILAIKMPIEEPPEFQSVTYHSSRIEQMKLTVDDKNLITCSDIGTICVWNLENIEGKTVVMDKDFKYFDEILISKNDLEEKLASIKDLMQRTYELEMEHAYQMRHIDTIYKEKIQDIHDTYGQALEELKGTLKIVETNHNTELNNISTDLNVMKERHEAKMLDMEAKYNAELIIEYSKVMQLEKTKISVTEEFETRLADLEATKERTIEELTMMNESKLYNLNKMVEEAYEEINKEVAEHNELTRQIEDDNDREIECLRAEYEKRLKDARETNLRLKGESGVLKKKIVSSEKETELIQMEIISATSDLKKFKQNVQALEQEILDLKKEIGERDLMIQDKEKKIYDLKRKCQEYERYKFVLNYRIKELKNQIEPRDKEIKEQKEKIAMMEVELYELQKVNLNLDNDLGSMREKLNSVYKLLHMCRSKCNVTMGIIKRVKTDIFVASGNIQDLKKLKDGVRKLYFKYITDKEFAKTRKGDEECIAELRRQKSHLESIVRSLEKEVQLSKQVQYGEGMVYMELNWTLMDEINKIRKKFKSAQSKIQDLETLICVRMAKVYSPRQAHRLIQNALRSGEEVKEECSIEVDEAVRKAALMREELDFLCDKIKELENVLNNAENARTKKKPRETLKFDIPSII